MRSRLQAREWRILYGIALLIIFGVYLLSLRTILSPFILFVALLALLTPYSGLPMHRNLLGASILLLALWLLTVLGSTLAPFVLGLILAYVLNPVADALERRGVNRMLAIALLLLPVLGAVFLLVVLGIPALADQIGTVVRAAPEALERLVAWINSLRARFAQVRIPFMGDATLAEYTLDTGRIGAYLEARQADLIRRAWGAVLGFGKGVSIVLGILGYAVLTPIIMVYVLRDYHKIGVRIEQLMPAHKRAGWMGFLREYDALLARYLRGQLIAASIVGVLTWLGLLVLGFPYPGLVGAVAGVFNIVPYLGLVVSAIPAVIIALLSGAVGASLLKAGIVFAIVQFIDGSVTGPRIVGESVGLHPVWVMLALAAGGVLFGFVGLLLAVPGAVLIKLLLREAVARYQQSALYLDATSAD